MSRRSSPSSADCLPREWGEAILRELAAHEEREQAQRREERLELLARIDRLEQTQTALLLSFAPTARRAGARSGATVAGAVIAAAGAVTAALRLFG